MSWNVPSASRLDIDLDSWYQQARSHKTEGDDEYPSPPHTHGYLYAYRNTLKMANRDLNRLKVVLAEKKRTNRWLAALKSILGKQILKKIFGAIR